MSMSSWQTETKFNRRDALVALAVALLAAVTALLFYLPRSQSGGLTVVISVGGEEVERISLTAMPDAPMHIEGRNGYTLSVSPSFNDLPGAKGIGVYVSHSDCPNQECVRTGVIRRAGQSIVCLPAQVVVYLEGTPAAGEPDVIVG